jgi:pSer/pThr/pTyr-binding forkhead associated (FHA) protein
MAAKVILTFTNGSLKGQRWEFTQRAKCLIGRAGDCDIQLPSGLEFREVSRHHCELAIDPPAAVVRDLGSRNGTFLNGVSIGQRPRGEEPGSAEVFTWHPLREGDELWIGDSTILVGTRQRCSVQR